MNCKIYNSFVLTFSINIFVTVLAAYLLPKESAELRSRRWISLG